MNIPVEDADVPEGTEDASTKYVVPLDEEEDSDE